MIAETLERLETDFPASTQSPMDAAHWPDKVSEYATSLHAIGSAMLSSLRPYFPERVFADSSLEVVVPRRPEITIGEFRLRPANGYYESVGATLPLPANPAGPHATGIAFSLCLYRGFINGRQWRPSRFSVEFCVWGERERAAFLTMFLDHRRAVRRLVRMPGLEFSSACWFDEVEKPASRSAATRMARYATVESDPENCFTLSRGFERKTTPQQLTAAAVPLLTLYDACFGYCKPRKAKGRLDQYSRRI